MTADSVKALETAEANDSRPSAEQLIRWIISQSPAEASLTASSPLVDLALGSRRIVELAAQLSERLGHDVPYVSFWEYRTVGELAEGILRAGEDPTRMVIDGSAGWQTTSEEVAIVGCSVRVPGASGCSEFWDMLANGRCSAAQTDLGMRAGIGSSRQWGSFFEDPFVFDPSWFHVSQREAETMDPQQRLLLELTHEAFENAGMCGSDDITGAMTGVFIGISNFDHGLNLYGGGAEDSFVPTGSALSVASGRIAYAFGLTGPTLSVDTGCSSSMTALHLAVQALRLGECDTAIVGGVSLALSPEVFPSLQAGGFLSGDGRCKSFSADADGYGRGEAGVVLILRRVADVPAGRALGVILGSALNSDGHSNGLTAPQLSAQVQVMRAACRAAGVDALDVSYVEAHGTGTPLGDPIEAESTSRVYGAGRDPERPCLMGSVKSNVGHAEAAAGLLGVLKVLMALRHDTIPASIGAGKANPAIAFEDNGLRLVSASTYWPRDRRRVAAVSAFSFGGSNAHVLVADPADEAVTQTSGGGRDQEVLVLSAADGERLKQYAQDVADVLETGGPSLRDVAGELNGRRRQENRLVVRASSTDEAADRLRERSRRPLTALASQVVLVVDGQGGQWPAMGRRLVEGSLKLPNEVIDLIERLDEESRRTAGWSLIDSWGRDGDAWASEPERVQPCVVALELVQAQRWHAHGLVPDAVVGHSLGEVAAASIAGAITPEDAMRIAIVRGEICASARGIGATAVIALGAQEVERLLVGHDDVWIVGLNSPRQTLVAGRSTGLSSFLDELNDDVFHSVVSRDYAFHSPLMEETSERLRATLDSDEGSRRPRRADDPDLPLYSTVSGKLIGSRVLGPDYWAENLRQPVRFVDAVHAMELPDDSVMLELGPHPGLRSALRDLLPTACVLASARRGDAEDATFDRSIATLIESGALPVPDGPSAYRHVGLPTAPWHHRSLRPPFGLKTVASAPRDKVDRPSRAAEPRGAAASDHDKTGTCGAETPPSVFITELCAVLHEEISEVSRDVPLVSLGIDSMMSLELAHRLEQRLGIPVSPSRLLGSLTVSDIEAGLADGSILSPDTSPLNGSMSTPSLEEQGATQLLAHLEELSDDEVTRLLAGFFDEDGQEQRRL